jgi:hypothetical protein
VVESPSDATKATVEPLLLTSWLELRIFVKVERTQMKALLAQIRRARAGTLSLNPVPEPIASYLGHGLGHLCDVLGVWFEADTEDRRAADAAIRYYGLGRMPESQSAIATSFPKRGERKGISARRVQQLIDRAIDRVEVRPLHLPVKRFGDVAAKPEDPFPMPVERSTRILMARVLLWAWADVTNTTGNDADAVLLYEYEHGLRSWSPRFDHPQGKARARLRALSMLHVAIYRLTEAIPSDPVVDRLVGPRLIVTLDPALVPEWDALMAFNQWPDLGDPHAAITAVRAAVLANRPEASDLLGLLRDGILKLRHPPADVTARVLALSVIASRQRRDPAGIVLADQLLSHLGEVVQRRVIGPEGRAQVATVLTSTLRAAHEAAELSYALGDMKRARLLIGAAHYALDEFGDPEQDVEPDGWLQQLLLFDASWLRRRARLGYDPERSLRWADAAAGRSADLVFEPGVLPIPWGLASEEQRIGSVVDLAEQELLAGNEDAAKRAVRRAETLINQQEANWLSLPQAQARPEAPVQVRVGLLGAARAGWKAALLEGDRDAIEASRLLTWQRMGTWTSPALVDKFRELDLWTRRIGAPSLVGPDELDQVSGLRDRGGTRVSLGRAA